MIDFIIADLDSIKDDEVRKINRPCESIRTEETLEGLKLFREKFKGIFWLHPVFLNGINDSEESVNEIIDFLVSLSPETIGISLGSTKETGPLPTEFKEKIERKLTKLSVSYRYL